MIRSILVQLGGFVIALFFGAALLIKLGPKKFFYSKKRPIQPQILKDPKWGSSEFVRLPDIVMHYVTKGDKQKPLMIFLHGFPEFWFSWRHQILHFSKDFWCVAPDMRGYGDTTKPTGIENYHIDLIADDIANLIKALGKKDCILVTHDWGGLIGHNLAERRPDLVKCLVSANSANPRAFHDVVETNWQQKMKSWYILFFQCPILPEIITRANDMFRLAENFKDMSTESDPEVLEAYKYNFRDQGALEGPINYYRHTLRNPAKNTGSKKQIIKVPILSIYGDQDKYISKDVIQRCGAYAEDFTNKDIKGISHWVQQEAPEEVNRIIQEFLKQRHIY